MGPYAFVAVGLGASVGAWLRWWLGLRLNGVLPTLPLGTLAANLIGGFLVGVAIALFDRHPSLPPEVRLLVITGFLGALTTFSTFSGEIVALLARGEVLWAAGAAAAHLFGSLLLTAGGIAAVSVLTGSAAS
jgi:CrcB protein